MVCPGCNQTIVRSPAGTECGGVGDGICTESAYAFDLLRGTARWEADGDPPSPIVCSAIRLAHMQVAAKSA